MRFCALALCLSASAAVVASPGDGPWRQYADPADAGFSASLLDAAHVSARELGSAAVLIIRDGVVAQAWGEIDHPYRTHSMRKSLYSVTFGAMLQEGIDLDATLADLKMDDLEGLTDAEKQATVRNLLTATSGVYHNAAYETDGNADRRPMRGAHEAGAHWYYNNWDFNALPAVFELQTGVSMGEAFSTRIAGPLGMEDFDLRRDVFDWLEPTVSRYPAPLIRISARDLARVGVLVLKGGEWDGAQIVPETWIAESTQAHTTFPEGHYRGAGNGYGYLWWRFPADPNAEDLWQRHDRIAATGAGGHAMFIVPSLDLVIVHRTDTDNGPGVADRDGAALMNLIVEAIESGVDSDAPTVAVNVRPLGREATVIADRGDRAPAEVRNALLGEFQTARGDVFGFFEYEGRLFAQRESAGSAEVELFIDAQGDLVSPIAPLRIRPGASVDGRIDSVTMWFRGREMALMRVTGG